MKNDETNVIVREGVPGQSNIVVAVMDLAVLCRCILSARGLYYLAFSQLDVLRKRKFTFHYV